MSIHNRLKQVVKYLIGQGVAENQERLGERLGYTNKASFSHILNERKPLPSDFIDRLSALDQKVNKVWIETGEGEMLKGNEPKATNHQAGYFTYLLPLSAMGGGLVGFAEKGVELKNCEAIVSPIKDVDFAITIYGESMSPEYPSGSKVLIKKIDPCIFIDWGKVYVLDTSNGVVVKEVHKSEKEEYVSCYSINKDPKFAPFEIPTSEIYGMYRVLMCLSMK